MILRHQLVIHRSSNSLKLCLSRIIISLVVVAASTCELIEGEETLVGWVNDLYHILCLSLKKVRKMGWVTSWRGDTVQRRWGAGERVKMSWEVPESHVCVSWRKCTYHNSSVQICWSAKCWLACHAILILQSLNVIEVLLPARGQLWRFVSKDVLMARILSARMSLTQNTW